MELTIEQALQQAVEAHKSGRLQDAEALYRAILQAQPKHPDANHNLGVMAVALNKTEAAIPLFKIALEANPNQAQFWLSYLDALIKTNQIEIAKSVLEQGKKLGLVGERVDALEVQLSPNFLIQNSQSLLESKHPTITQQNKKTSSKKEKKKNAPRNLTKLHQRTSPPQIELNILIEHYNKGRYVLAQNVATTLTQQYPKHSFGWKVLGVVLQQVGKLQESLIAYQKVSEISPNDAEAYNNLGITLKNLGRLEEAEASCRKALANKPDYAEAHSNLGNILHVLGRLKEAETSYKNAIAIKPEYDEAYNNLGIALEDLGRLEEAETSYKKAIAIKPCLEEAYINLGSILQGLGRLEEAEAIYKKAIAINPDLAEASNNLGVILKELGRLEEAEASCRKALANKPNYAEAHSNLGNILRELGRPEEAETSYRKALEIKPDLADAHTNLGNTLQELGRLEEAEASFVQAIRLKPDGIQARSEMLDCLYLMDKKLLFYDQLDYLIKQDKANAAIGSLTCRSALRYGEEKTNIFCKEPLKHVLLVDLKSRYNFEEIFIRNVKSILGEDKWLNRTQPLLLNGYQTSGNLFGMENKASNEIQKAIRLEIKRYRINLENSQEGFIKKWPTEFSLFGWIISMKSGGELLSHIHEKGWLSGSIYINVPPKLKIDSGNLVVALGKDSDATNSRKNSKKIIDVVTGSMVLFPASLMHHTIPFESEEERIVLAFDVIPKS